MNIETVFIILVTAVAFWAIAIAGSRRSDGNWKFQDPFRPWRG